MDTLAGSFDRKGPSIWGVDPWVPGNPRKGTRHQLFSDAERARLAVISSIVGFKKGETIYRAGDRADAIFNIISGVVKSYSGNGDGRILAGMAVERHCRHHALAEQLGTAAN